jgi:tight adherence protein B
VKRRHGRPAVIAFFLAALFALLAMPAASAQEEDSASSSGMLTIRQIDGTDQRAVKLTFLWTGDANELSDLVIRENGAAVQVDDLVDLRSTGQGIATVVVVDLSGSMNDDSALTWTKEAIADMARNLPAGDQIAVVGFSNDAAVETAFTSNVDQVQSALDGMAAPSDGRTAMYDAIRKATSLFTTRPDLQPNVLLVTDGADDVSTADLDAARASVVSSGAAFFAVQLTHMDEVDTGAINSIIERTGGAAFSGTTEAEVSKAFTDVLATMRSQYVASYASQVDQGSIDVSVAVGAEEVRGSYVAGATADGARATQVVLLEQAWGPEWLRSSPILPVVFVGLGLGLLIYALIQLAGRNETGLSAVLSPYTEGAPADQDDNEGSLAQTAFLQRAVEMTEDFAERQGFLEKVSSMLERADLPLRAAEALFFYIAGVILIALMGFLGIGLMGGLMLGVLAALLPLAVVSFLAGRRAKQFVNQLPDTLQLLSGSLRAGYSLMQGVEAVSQEVDEPMGKELRRVVTEARLGRELEESLDAVAERMSSPDFEWAVMAIRIQREVGGNLAELLLTVSETMVQRDRLRRDVASLTAEGKISAIILGLLPVGLGLFMWGANPAYMAPLGTTGLGQIMLGLSFVSVLIGFVWMKKTITIEI